MLPRVARTRPGGLPKWHCPSCLETTSEETRRSLHCGWMPREKWVGDEPEVPPVFVDGERVKYDHCPGWLVRQPLITEISQAWRVFETGNFDSWYPHPSNILCEGVLELDRAIHGHEAEEMRREREKRQLESIK